MQQGRDIGFRCHVPYTNNKQLHRITTVSRSFSETGLWPSGKLLGEVQQGRDIGFHCHAPYTNSISNCTESRPFPVHCLMYCQELVYGVLAGLAFLQHRFPQHTLLLCAAVHPPTPGHQLRHHNSYTATPTLHQLLRLPILQSNLIPTPVQVLKGPPTTAPLHLTPSYTVALGLVIKVHLFFVNRY